MNFRDLTGQRFAMLTAVRRAENSSTAHQARWLFRCDCGAEVVAFGFNVAHGRQKSCGCYKVAHPSRLCHGMTARTVHNIWCGMRQRCYNPDAPAFEHYGARGIEVCDRWRDSFENFLADMGEPPEGASIERIDNDGPYSPDNCRWASRLEQVRNRRVSDVYEFRGKKKHLAEWAAEFGIPYQTLWHRYSKRGWRGEKLFSPLRITVRSKSKT